MVRQGLAIAEKTVLIMVGYYATQFFLLPALL